MGDFANSAVNTTPQGLDFGHALTAVKQGKLIARAGWNGPGMFVFQRPADELSVDFIRNKVKSLPQALKDYYGGNYSDPSNGDAAVPASEVMVKFSAYLCLKTQDGQIQNGWAASQADMLATDWLVLD
jgi:hypothetical protein